MRKTTPFFRHVVVVGILLAATIPARTQNIGINSDGSDPDPDAMLDIDASNKGILIPRVTSGNKPSSPTKSMLIYQSDGDEGYYYYDGSNWVPLLSGSPSKGVKGWGLKGNANTSPGTNFLGTTDANDLVLKTNGTERARVLSGGNVGIGTNSPSHLLEVDGNISLTSGGSGNIYGNRTSGTFYIFGNTDTDDGPAIEMYGDSHGSRPGDLSLVAGDGGKGIRFWDYNGSDWDENMTIKTDGRVGIADSDPEAWAKLKLQVDDDDDAFYINNSDGTSNTNTIFRIDANSGLSNALRVERNGRVGINTGSPTAGSKLEIVGGTDPNGSTAPLIADGMMIGNNEIDGGADNKLHLNLNVGGDVTLGVGGGNTGVGTTSPNAKLHVKDGGFPVFNAERTTTNTGNFVTTTRVVANTSNDAGNGFGGGMGFAFTDGGVTNSLLGSIGAVRDGADNSGKLVFNTYDGGSFQSQQMVIEPAGNVGIGDATPDYELDVDGDINATGQLKCSGADQCSDQRYKKDVEPIASPLQRIDKIQGVYYSWRVDAFPDRNFEEDRQIGVIAQQVEEVYPELVSTWKDGYKGVDYGRFSAILLEATKAQQDRIESLETKNEKLEAENEELKKRLRRLEQGLERIRERLPAPAEAEK